jgi:hypothetical protein
VQTLDPGFYLTAALTILGGIAWALRLEGRVNTTTERFEDLKNDVNYIRRRIDEALDR